MPVSMTPYRVFPDYRHIDPAFFTRHGIRLLLCDLDYTLAPKSQPEPDDALRRWLSEVQAAGVTVMILSNNRSPARVERFCRDLGITYEGHAGKPSPRGFRRSSRRAAVRLVRPLTISRAQPEKVKFWKRTSAKGNTWK